MSAVAVVAAAGWSIRIRRRALLVSIGLVIAVCAGIVVSLAAGANPFGLSRVLAVLTGGGTPAEKLIIGELRLPRAATAALVGLALGLAGAIFQSLTRNPLGSPDVVGFNYGASSGALIVLLYFHGGLNAASFGAVAGGGVTAAVVFLLSSRQGVSPLRLVLVGLGVGSALDSLNSLMMVRSQLYDAQTASAWLVGNLAGSTGGDAYRMGGVLVVGAALCLALVRPLTLGEFSDERSTSLGLNVGRMRLLAVATGILLASSAVAIGGPIQFVALAAPQIARRLTAAPGPNLFASGFTGALLLVLADFAAREAFQPRQLPVGVLTGVVGGAYLAWLLGREWRKGRA